MSSFSLARRTRSGPRGRNGCSHCKKSRVKCTEEKPQCRRCVRLKVACNYIPPKADSKPSLPVFRTVIPATKPVTTLAQYRINSTGLDSLEVGYFSWFRQGVAPRMDVEMVCSGTNFWLRTIPRETARNEGVRNFVIGIGAMDLAMSQLKTAQRPGSRAKPPMSAWNPDYKAALRAYTKAITLFRTQVADQENPIQPRTFLIYCILQATFEALQGNIAGYANATATGFEVLKHRIMQDEQPIAASIDDEGIEEATVMLSRIVAVSDLMGLLKKHPKAPIIIAVPIRIFIPDKTASTQATIRTFNAFYCRSIIWVLEVARSAAAGTADMKQVSRDITIIISQLREWDICLGTRAAATVHYLHRPRLQVHQIEAKFGVVFLFCFMYRCGWEIYTAQCLEMLMLAKTMVLDVESVPEDTKGIGRSILSIKLMPLVNRIVENCRDPEVRARGLQILTMITRFSQTSMWEFTMLLLHQSALAGRADEVVEGAEFDPETRYSVLGYTWDEPSDAFKVTLMGSTKDEEGNYAQRVVTVSYGQLMTIIPTVDASKSLLPV